MCQKTLTYISYNCLESNTREVIELRQKKKYTINKSLYKQDKKMTKTRIFDIFQQKYLKKQIANN